MGMTVLSGGAFQDAQGTPLALGYLSMELCSDEQAQIPLSQVAGGIVIRIPLDNNGNVADAPKVWANDSLFPANSCYLVDAFTRNGTRAWKAPQYQKVPSSAQPFNVSTWVPGGNSGCGCGSGQGGGLCPEGILLQTNSINNGDQCKLNLVACTGVTLVDDGDGDITITSTGGGGGGSGATYYDAIIPSGAIDGNNTAFVLPASPNPTGSLMLVQDGVVLSPGGVGFTLSGANITCTNAPVADLLAWFRTSNGGLNFADAEIPSGSINSSNTAFALAHTPNPSGSLLLVQDGIVLSFGGVGFTLVGANITTATAPVAALIAWYRY